MRFILKHSTAVHCIHMIQISTRCNLVLYLLASCYYPLAVLIVQLCKRALTNATPKYSKFRKIPKSVVVQHKIRAPMMMIQGSLGLFISVKNSIKHDLPNQL